MIPADFKLNHEIYVLFQHLENSDESCFPCKNFAPLKGLPRLNKHFQKKTAP